MQNTTEKTPNVTISNSSHLTQCNPISLDKRPTRSQTLWKQFGGWMILESLLIFALFAMQGAWSIPDVNEPCYVGKSIRFWNAAWAQGDFFLESANPHAAYYVTLGWLSLYLTPIAFTWTVRIFGWLLLAIGWQRLSSAIIPRAGVSILTATIFAYLAESCTLAGEWVIGGTESKVFAYAAVFGAIAACLRRRWNLGWLLIGFGTLFHVLVGGWTGVILGAVWLCGKIAEHRETRQKTRRTNCPSTLNVSPTTVVKNPAVVPMAIFPTLRAMLPGLIGGALIALPGLWLSLRLNAGVDAATAAAADYISVYRRLPFHLYLHGMDANRILRFFWQVLAFGIFGLLLVGRQTRSAWGQRCVLLSGVAIFGTQEILAAQKIDGTHAEDAATLAILILCAIGVFILLSGWMLRRFHRVQRNAISQQNHQCQSGDASMMTMSMNTTVSSARVCDSCPQPRQLMDKIVLGSLVLVLIGGFWSWFALYFEQYALAARVLKFYWFRLADIFVPIGLSFRAVEWILASCGKSTVSCGKLMASCGKSTSEPICERRTADDSRWWLGTSVGTLCGRCGGYLLYSGLVLFAVLYAFDLGQKRVSTWNDPPRAEAKMRPNEWIAACDWIQNSDVIPSDARFLTPRENSTFTWRTGRPQVVTRKDFPQDARSIVVWYARLQEIHSPHPEFPWPNWFSSLSERKPDDLRRIAEKYDAPYLIVETKHALPFERLYVNERYAIYRLD